MRNVSIVRFRRKFEFSRFFAFFRVLKMKSIVFLTFIAICSAAFPRRYGDYESDDMLKRDPINYDQATDADIAAYLKQALNENKELKSYLKELQDDDEDVLTGKYLKFMKRFVR